MLPATQGIHVGEADHHPGFAGTCTLLGVKEVEAKWDALGGLRWLEAPVFRQLNRTPSLCGGTLMKTFRSVVLNWGLCHPRVRSSVLQQGLVCVTGSMWVCGENSHRLISLLKSGVTPHSCSWWLWGCRG